MLKKSKLVLAVALTALSIASYVSAITYVGIPETVDDYINTSHVIVTGQIGSVSKIHRFYGYQENAAELERLDARSTLHLGVPMVDYEIIVDEVLATDGFYNAEYDQPLVLRVVRAPDDVEELAVTEDGGKFIFFLSRNPDNETYGFYTFAHKVNIDEEDNPKYFFGGESYEVLDGFSSSELIAAVRGGIIN